MAAFFHSRTICFQNGQNFERPNFDRAKISITVFLRFLKAITISFTVQIVELFTLHLVVYLAFNKTY